MPSLNTKLASAPNTQTNYVLKATSSTTIGNSLIFDNGTFVGINTTNPSYQIDVAGAGRFTTGLYFNNSATNGAVVWQSANESLRFATNDTERMRISASGNVGIGATPTDFGSSYTVLDVYNGTIGGYLLARSPNVTGQISVDNNTAMYVQTRTNHPILFAPNNTERMRITSSGNVGIGTSSPTSSARVEIVSGYTAGLYVRCTNNEVPVSLISEAVSVSTIGFKGNTSTNEYNVRCGANGNDFIAYTSNTERMRITSGGNVLVGGTSDTGNKMQVYGSFGSFGSGAISLVQARDLSTQYGWYADNSTYLYFYNTLGGNVTGQFTRATGVYTALSDINKKKDIEESKIGLNEILALKPTLYRMKEDADTSEKHLGFIAQEVKEHIPQAYVESGEFIGLTDRPIIAALVKAIQEQQAQIEELKALINK